MSHRYVRAYMAGIAAPTSFLLVVLGIFCVARFLLDATLPIERVIVFPMALLPNLFGAWNVFYVGFTSRRLSIGVHGALLPFILIPIGVGLGTALGIVRIDPAGLVAFDTVPLPYARAALVFPIVIAVYYLVWKYVVGFLNDLVNVR